MSIPVMITSFGKQDEVCTRKFKLLIDYVTLLS